MKAIPALDRYIFRLVLMPMLGVFLIAASLLMLDKMLKLFEFVGTEGGPISVVFRMLANLIPEYASLAIPLGLMLGILFAFRKLATSTSCLCAAAAATPTIRLAVETIPSLAPSTAARSQPIRAVAWVSAGFPGIGVMVGSLGERRSQR